jgi:hypothetical protein
MSLASSSPRAEKLEEDSMVFGIALVVVAGVISAFGITQVRHSAPPVPEPWPACGLSLGPSGWRPS